MRNALPLFCLFLLLIVPCVANAERDSFLVMPHEKILELEHQKCADQELATAGRQKASKCNKVVDSAFKELVLLHDKGTVPLKSWDLCYSQSYDGTTFSYPVLALCMRSVQKICKVNESGEYVNMSQCYRVMMSGEWARMYLK